MESQNNEQRPYQLLDMLRMSSTRVIDEQGFAFPLFTQAELESIKVQLFLELGVNLDRQ